VPRCSQLKLFCSSGDCVGEAGHFVSARDTVIDVFVEAHVLLFRRGCQNYLTTPAPRAKPPHETSTFRAAFVFQRRRNFILFENSFPPRRPHCQKPSFPTRLGLATPALFVRPLFPKEHGISSCSRTWLPLRRPVMVSEGVASLTDHNLARPFSSYPTTPLPCNITQRTFSLPYAQLLQAYPTYASARISRYHFPLVATSVPVGNLTSEVHNSWPICPTGRKYPRCNWRIQIEHRGQGSRALD